jgi:hypothetical protein
MSADNFIGVYRHGDEWVVCHGMMSPLVDAGSEEFGHHYPDGYWGSERSRHPSEDEAWAAASKAYKDESIVEYGVISLGVRPNG